jgi:glycosyltransferase involved in cell wall biosynthesis
MKQALAPGASVKNLSWAILTLKSMMRGKLRILQVVPTYFPAVRYGGPIRSVHALGAALVERGHHVEVFTTSVDGPNDSDVSHEGPVDMDGVQVNYFRVRVGRRLYWCPELAQALKRRIRQFDLVHLHSVFLWPTWAAARIARRAQVPYVLSPRGSLSSDLIRRRSRWIKTAWISMIEERTIRESAALHVTSEVERREVAELNLPTGAVHCVPNGVAWPARRSTLADGPFRGLSREPYVLFLSRVDFKKGLDRLIRAWQWLPQLKLIIAGNDEVGYRQHLEQIAAQCDVQARIEFVGAASDEHKWALYENALLFVLPSYSENFGNVVAEAMAMACPVLVTPEVGAARLVQETGAGVVVEGDPQRLAEAISQLAADEPRRRAMGERGRAAVQKHLSWASAAGEMETVYQDILSERRVHRACA